MQQNNNNKHLEHKNSDFVVKLSVIELKPLVLKIYWSLYTETHNKKTAKLKKKNCLCVCAWVHMCRRSGGGQG